MKGPRMVAFLAMMLARALLVNGQSSRPPITGISHISVYAAEANKTENFYVHSLGAVKGTDPENPKGVRYYFSPKQFVEVLPLPQDYSSINRLDHVAFATSDADALRRYMGAHGVSVPSVVQSGSDGAHWFVTSDPEGNRVEFVQAPASLPQVPLDPLGHHIIHVGYMVHNRDNEDAFYRTVLGFRPYWFGGPLPGVTAWISQQVPDGSDWLEYMMVNGPDTRGIPGDMTPDRLGSMDHFSLGVPDIKTVALVLYNEDRIPEKSNGPKIGRDGKWQYNLFSPDGTRAEIMELQPVGKPCCSPFTASNPTE